MKKNAQQKCTKYTMPINCSRFISKDYTKNEALILI
jgi:hypothetical protein